MTKKIDTVIIGGGIAGLMTALRLSGSGQGVVVIEKDKIGSGITISNHGMIHSGALYVQKHPNIVKNCQEANILFSSLFSEAIVTDEKSIYIVDKERFYQFSDLLTKYGIDFDKVDRGSIQEIKSSKFQPFEFLAIKEGVFSSRQILFLLLSYCLGNGVEFILGDKVQKVVIKNGRTSGVILSSGVPILCKNVVIATGLGTEEFLSSFKSYYCQFLKSRLDMMVYLPHSYIKRGMVFAELNKAVLMPEVGGGTLASFFGGIQPPISREWKFPVDFEKAKLLIRTIKNYFDADIVNTSDAQFYMSGKTDYVGDESTEKGFINPGYHIIDHSLYDKISGLYTIATGKMTLAFHSSRDVVNLILRANLGLKIDKSKRVEPNSNMLEVEPWNGFLKN